MFHTGRDCAARQPLLFPTVKIESSLGNLQASEIRRALESDRVCAQPYHPLFVWCAVQL